MTIARRLPLALLTAAQAALGARVLLRLARTSWGETIRPAPAPAAARASVLVPVLNEVARLGPCLDGLLLQGPEVAEILVVDCGSDDGTQDLVRRYAERDLRLRLLATGPLRPGANGKAQALQTGLDAAREAWVLTIDADVRPAAGLAAALLAHAERRGLKALSVATRQEIDGFGQGLIHPSLLSTLVYRFGIPGGTARSVPAVQANGQCFLARTDTLRAIGGFAAVAESICEDVTIGRRLVAHGVPLGFFEAGDLVSVRMYPDWRALWRNWPRSLPMRDRYFGPRGALGLAEVLLVQALPLPLLGLLGVAAAAGAPAPPWAVATNTALAATRLGVLAGTARAYRRRPPTYWLSPLVDLPASLTLIASALRRRHVWRGRELVRGYGERS